jgi:limonene-1,2-epoxide hydrolase
MEAEGGQIVARFIAAVEAKDLDTALAMVTDDCHYDNVPMGAVDGRDAMRTTLAPFVASASEIEWVVKHQVAAGDTVMNERLDRFHVGDRWIEIPVAGLFVLRDGRISLWRDYFDLASFTSQMSGG